MKASILLALVTAGWTVLSTPLAQKRIPIEENTLDIDKDGFATSPSDSGGLPNIDIAPVSPLPETLRPETNPEPKSTPKTPKTSAQKPAKDSSETTKVKQITPATNSKTKQQPPPTKPQVKPEIPKTNTQQPQRASREQTRAPSRNVCAGGSTASRRKEQSTKRPPFEQTLQGSAYIQVLRPGGHLLTTIAPIGTGKSGILSCNNIPGKIEAIRILRTVGNPNPSNPGVAECHADGNSLRVTFGEDAELFHLSKPTAINSFTCSYGFPSGSV